MKQKLFVFDTQTAFVFLSRSSYTGLIKPFYQKRG